MRAKTAVPFSVTTRRLHVNTSPEHSAENSWRVCLAFLNLSWQAG